MARPVFPWFGGKARLVSWLSQYVPYGDGYCEPFCGAASLFFARKASEVEYLNDLDGDVVNLFRVLQNVSLYEELRHRLRHTLYSRQEYRRAKEMLRCGGGSSVDLAWAFFVSQHQGFSGARRSNCAWSCGDLPKPDSFANAVDLLDFYVERLRGVYIECCDGVELIGRLDGPMMVFYVDPPYHHDVRCKGSTSEYSVEMDHDDHVRLVDVLSRCRGAVALSGYHHPLYDGLGWRVVEKEVHCYAIVRKRGEARCNDRRVECLWLNRRCEEMLGLGGLFGG